MRIGVVSDTHNNLKSVAKIVSIFNDQKVEKVVHTGDITQSKTVEAFAEIKMPMYGVYGNNDLELESLTKSISKLGYYFVQPPFIDIWCNKKMIVVHDPLLLNEYDLSEYNLAIHGHTHRYRMERINSTLIFNPGECAGHMTGFNAVGVIDLESMDTEIIKF